MGYKLVGEDKSQETEEASFALQERQESEVHSLVPF